MDKTYISIAELGSYEDKVTSIVFAGTDYEQAIKMAEDASLTTEGERNGDINAIWVEHWENGNKVKHEEIVN